MKSDIDRSGEIIQRSRSECRCSARERSPRKSTVHKKVFTTRHMPLISHQRAEVLPVRKMDSDRIREFYCGHPPDLSCITDVNKRHFRLLLPNGRFFKVKDVIRTPMDLQRWLIRLSPLDVYYSTSTYLNPTSVSPRPRTASEYWGPGNIILGNDVAFDLDRRPLSILNLERARKDAVRLLDLMLDRQYSLKYAAFSGSKGFHLVFSDRDTGLEEDHRSREKEIIGRRKALVEEVTQRGIRIDTSVTVDTRRIIRLPGTLNSKTGYCCQTLTLEQLRAPVAEWLDVVERIEGHRTIPRFGWKPLSGHRPALRTPHPDGEVEVGYTTYITSSVLGTKGRHAVLLTLPRGTLEGAVRRLSQAQRVYDLTDVYIFELPRSYQVICLKTVQRNRYQKILDSVRSPSSSQLRRYDRVSLRMGPLIDQNMRELEPSAKFVTFLECPAATRERTFVSRGHIDFLEKHGFTPLVHPRTHGSGEFKLVDAEVRL